MKLTTIIIALLIFSNCAYSQIPKDFMNYEPSEENPFGLPNPSTPEVLEFKEMIGICDCKSISRNSDQTWSDTTQMIWKYKYIMNGTAVQDEIWRDNNNYAGRIRQYHRDSATWVVSYY